MTPTLANFIGDSFEAVTHIDSPENPFLGTDFDATVWRGTSKTKQGTNDNDWRMAA